jgi:hypothetical protein
MSNEEEYKMNMDEEDDEFFEEQEDSDVHEDGGSREPMPEVYANSTMLDFLATIAVQTAALVKLDMPTLRHTLFEQSLNQLAQSSGVKHEDLILAASTQDEGYNSLIESVFPSMAPYLRKSLNEGQNGLLTVLLTQAVSVLVWGQIESVSTKRGYDEGRVIALAQNLISEAVAYKRSSIGVSPFVDSVAVDKQESNKTDREAIYDIFTLLQAMLDGVKPEEEAKPPVEDIEDEEEEEEEEDPEVEAATGRIMRVYKDLFEVGFELQLPVGIATKDGYLRIRKGVSYETKQASIARIVDLVNRISGGGIVQSEVTEGSKAEELRQIDMRKGTSYYPEFQLGNLFGILGNKKVDSWSELSRDIQPEIKRNISSNVKAGKDINQIVDALTTAVVISEFEPNSALKLRFNVGKGQATEVAFRNEYAKCRNDIMHGTGDLFHIKQLPSGVVEVILVFNEAAFNGRPLFAYEAVKNMLSRGRKPSLREMVLGQDTSGKILTIDLDRQAASIMLIGAGQRSGKGVLTLNMLGTILSEGNPLIYMDGKPDMAKVLWNLGNKYNQNPAVWDLFNSNGNMTGVGAPDRLVTENPQFFGLLVYLKVVHLMMLAATLQAFDGRKFGNGKRPFFIFDEALVAQSTMSTTWSSIFSTAKSKTADADEKEWATHVVRWVEAINSGLPSVINSQLPMSGISTVWLFQSMQPTSWNQFQVDGFDGKINVLKNPLMSRLSIKMLGRGTSDSEYGLGNQKVKENREVGRRVLADGGRHFAMTGSQKITDPEDLKIFKPYLVLNESQNGTSSADELRKNVSNQVWDVIAPSGELDPGAGFEGFATLLGEEAIQNLDLGREYLEDVMRSVGLMDRYSSVEEYLYDASMESFQTVGTLASVSTKEQLTDTGFEYTPDIQDASDLPEFTSHGGTTSPVQGNSHTEESGYDGQPYSEGDQEKRNQDPGSFDNQFDSTDNPQYFSQQNHDFVEPEKQNLPPRQSIEEDPYVSPVEASGYAKMYREPMDIPSNPFSIYGTSDKPISAITSLKMMSRYLMDEIKKMVGDYSRIESFEVTATGLVINNVGFRPQFDSEIVESMPYDIRLQVSEGNVAELFHFGNLRRFSNLVTLRIDNPRLAEGRVRREIGLSPRKTWHKLFNWFHSLRELYIGGSQITDEVSSQAYEDGGRGGFSLSEKLRKAFGLGASAVSSSRMDRVWDSRPVRVATGAVGATLGVKAVTMAAAFFGPWGLLFGAFAGFGAYREFKNRRSRE